MRTGSSTAEVLGTAEEMVRDGRGRDAIRFLTEENRRSPDPEVEERLVTLRHEAFAEVPRRPADSLPGPVRSRPGAAALPEVAPAELDLATLRDGLSRQGCVLVRGLIPPEEAAELAAGIDRALAAFDAADEGREADDRGWYAQFTPRAGDYRVGGRRRWVRASGALWTADSPRMLFALTELVARTGIGALVEEYLGERPALSANKCTLRRVPLSASGGWHQDGAFLGRDVRTLNLWLALGPCGTDAPGLDIVPRRFDDVVETGTEGATFDWSVAPDVVARAADGVGVVRPEFAAGDALLFDHLLLHSTAVTAAMTRERPAIETWFFSPSAYPAGQIPLTY